MAKDYDKYLFRLSAVLYAGNNDNGILSTQTIYRKIIESVLFETENGYTIHEIIDYIYNNYHLTFEENEIIKIIDKKDNSFIKIKDKISINPIKKQSLQNNLNKSIDNYIEQFKKANESKYVNINIKEVILQFLYNTFTTNINSFHNLISSKKISNICEDDKSYTEQEETVIYDFLNWDNVDKNKAIFNVASYALEFCMLTNKKETTSLKIDNLKKKKFYLDTNVIYRVLGIHGEDRKKRETTFITKLKELDTELLISKYTDREFRESIKRQIKKISDLNTSKYNSKYYYDFAPYIQDDIFVFYGKWRLHKSNSDVALFQSFIFSQFDDFIKLYHIKIDEKNLLNEEDDNVKQKLIDYENSIQKEKSFGAKVDARNILWIEQKRKENNQSIFNTSYFLSSTDKRLQKWDSCRNTGNAPLVILPSQWLSIILKYIARSDNDYKSFVAFINLKNNETLIDGEKFSIVLSGISEVTTDVNQQMTFVENLIASKFEHIMSDDTTTLMNNAKVYAKTELEKQVKRVTDQNENLNNRNNKLSQDFKDLKSKVDNSDTELQQRKKKNEQLVNKLVVKDLRNWKNKGLYCLIIAFILIIYLFFCIIYPNSEWNAVLLIDNISSNGMQNILIGLLILLYGSGLCYLIKKGYDLLFSKDQKEKKEKELRNKYNE